MKSGVANGYGMMFPATAPTLRAPCRRVLLDLVKQDWGCLYKHRQLFVLGREGHRKEVGNWREEFWKIASERKYDPQFIGKFCVV